MLEIKGYFEFEKDNKTNLRRWETKSNTPSGQF